MTLDAYLKADPARCPGCGYHPPTQGHGRECAPVAPVEAGEWAAFVAALRSAAVDGIVHQSAVRPLIRGRIYHKHIGQLYSRARREGLLTPVGEEPSKDVAGRNTHHRSPVYRLRGWVA